MIAREDMIAQSLQTHLREHLFGPPFNYPQARVEIVDGFDEDLFDEQYPDGLTKTFIAAAYQFDNGGEQVEMGSTLTSYLHTIDFMVLGHTPTWGRNVAHVIKTIFRTDTGTIPLRDYSVTPNPPVVDQLVIEEVGADREYLLEPKPWQVHAWTTRVRMTDETFATTPV